MGAIIEVKYFNTFLLKKTTNSDYKGEWAGSLGIPESLGGFPRPVTLSTEAPYNWVIEESRITGGYNNTSVDFGVRAYLVEEEPNANIRGNSLIYSGIFNSRTGVNNTNVFSIGDEITRSLDPANGSIQRLYAEDTNLIIYPAEGGGSITSSNAVIGQNIAYAGNYGISKDPLSFAVYGYRKYFTDRYRNSVLRLSQDGITEISEYGMTDFFRDTFTNISSANYGQGNIIGSWDAYNKQYGTKYQYLTPCNLYGLDDKDGENNSHFITALIKKIFDAKRKNENKITLYGDGTPLRQFMYSDDFAKVIYDVIDKEIYDSFNVASFENLSIKEMSEIALSSCESEHLKIIWDNTKPNGQYRKDVSIEKLKSLLPKFNPISLSEGIKLVYKNYYDKVS